MRLKRFPAALVTCVILGAVLPGGNAADAVPVQHLDVRSALPPGNASTVTVAGQALGTATGDRAAFGPHTDDQRALYWNEQFKSSNFSRSGPADTPTAGVSIYRDAFGVPAIYGTTARNVWFGAGYAGAQDRLFLMDGVRRSAEGRLAELTGPSTVPADVKARYVGYSDDEYASLYAGLSTRAKDAFDGYTDGVNAYLAKIQTDPTLLPAEYALLQATPEQWTVKDSLASGVFMTRFVASEGGNEMNAVRWLSELSSKLGQAKGRAAYLDLFPVEDDKAVTTIRPEDGRFDDVDTPRAQRAAAFTKMADWAKTLPAGLADGPGTGAYPAPAAAGSPGAGANQSVPAALRVQDTIAAALNDWRAHLHGGSYAIALSGKKTTTGKAMLESAPQLGWTSPSYLYEIEIHGGGYDARGVTVPGLPVVGIGYNANVAWALTTGYSKTIDSFIETTRTWGGKLQYLYNHRWVDTSCRNETVSYRNRPNGVPVGPPLRSVTTQICRTIHGPIVASAGGFARSLDFAMWMREISTIEGVLGWNQARNIKDFEVATSKVTWNENVTVADSGGHIGYFHPGLYPIRTNGVDQRLPTPGTGAYDWYGFRPFSRMPHVVDPSEGFLTNWNNKPALGWTSGETQSQIAGPSDRMGVIRNLVLAAGAISPQGLAAIDRRIGQADARARVLLKPLLAAIRDTKLYPSQQAGRAALQAWNGFAGGPGSGELRTASKDLDGVGATLFEEYVTTLRARIAKGLSASLVASLTHIENHKYNSTRLDDLAQRLVDPASTSLTLKADWTHGVSVLSLQRLAFNEAVAATIKKYGPDPSKWMRVHPTTHLCTLTGVIGAPCIDMRYEDRGSWIQLVTFL